MKLLPLLLLSVCCWISVGAFLSDGLSPVARREASYPDKRSAEESDCMKRCKASGKDEDHCRLFVCLRQQRSTEDADCRDKCKDYGMSQDCINTLCQVGKKRSTEDADCMSDCLVRGFDRSYCLQMCPIFKRSAEEQPLTWTIRQRDGHKCRAECKDSQQKDVCEKDCRAAAGVDPKLIGKRSAVTSGCMNTCQNGGHDAQYCRLMVCRKKRSAVESATICPCGGPENCADFCGNKRSAEDEHKSEFGKRSAEEQPLTWTIRQREGKRCSAVCMESHQRDVCERDCRAAAGVDPQLIGKRSVEDEHKSEFGKRSTEEEDCIQGCNQKEGYGWNHFNCLKRCGLSKRSIEGILMKAQ